MIRTVGLLACFTMLASPVVLAQGKPEGTGGARPPASAPRTGPERERAREEDRERILQHEGDGQRNPNEDQQALQKRCQERAHERGLKGEEHRRFMQQCMGNVPDPKREGGQAGQKPPK